MKCIGLDIGDTWTGIALSDSIQMFARPYTTVQTKELTAALTDIFKKEQISTVVVGHPKTMRGTSSNQTQSVEAFFEHLKTVCSTVEWLLWDERLSSRRAEHLKKAQTKEDKKSSHALAAAFILTSYLDHKAFIRAS